MRPRLPAAYVLVAAVAAVLVAAAVVSAVPVKTSRALLGADADAPTFVPGELVVLFDDGVSAAAVAAAVDRAGGALKSRSRVTPSRVVVSVPKGKEDAYAAAYVKLAGVRVAEKNFIYRAFWVPNDTYYPLQWHFNKPNFIKAETGWDLERGNASVVVAVIDTGVAYENYAVPPNEAGEVTGGAYAQAPDLAGTSFVAGYDFVHGDDHPNDQNGHGTHVSGTIAETTDNAADVAGLAHHCSIMPIQVLDYSGSGAISVIADGIDFARLHGANVVNMSFGGDQFSDVLKKACDDANGAGLTLCAAAGNSSSPVLMYPAAYDSVISVAAVDYNGVITGYSNYGFGLDISAPGGDNYADLNGDGYGDGVLQMTYNQMYDPNSGAPADVTTFANVFLQGTSMACPHVSALCALILAHGAKNNTDVKNRLLGGATDLGGPGYDTTYGYGLINCEASLQPEVPLPGQNCGNCAPLSKLEVAAYFGLFGLAYGAVWIRRRFKK